MSLQSLRMVMCNLFMYVVKGLNPSELSATGLAAFSSNFPELDDNEKYADDDIQSTLQPPFASLRHLNLASNKV